jgi:hypothetical protein
MAKRLDELKSGIQESFKDGYESEKIVTESPIIQQPMIQEPEIIQEQGIQEPIKKNDEIVQDSKKVIEEKAKVIKDIKKKVTKNESSETKTRRFPLLVRPSLYVDIEKIAYMNKISANEQINRCLEELRQKEKDKIKKYDEFMS